MYEIVSKIYGQENICFHYRPEWLEGLEIDIFIANSNIAIEYQGIQHYKPLNHWGGEDGFIKQRTNDIRKRELCEQNGVRLIYFYYYEKITNELVIERLSPYIN